MSNSLIFSLHTLQETKPIFADIDIHCQCHKTYRYSLTTQKLYLLQNEPNRAGFGGSDQSVQ